MLASAGGRPKSAHSFCTPSRRPASGAARAADWARPGRSAVARGRRSYRACRLARIGQDDLRPPRIDKIEGRDGGRPPAGGARGDARRAAYVRRVTRAAPLASRVPRQTAVSVSRWGASPSRRPSSLTGCPPAGRATQRKARPARRTRRAGTPGIWHR